MNRFGLCSNFVLLVSLTLLQPPATAEPSPQGYYRFPAIHGETIVFTAEGDLWTVDRTGGVARRLTSHQGEETLATISPDGRTVAYSAAYEGPTEIYTIPLAGGLPRRQTWESERSLAVGWTPGGDLVYATYAYSTLPDPQLVIVDPTSQERRRIPLHQASDGVYDASGRTLYFSRPGFHNNNTKRYRGGTARNVWRFAEGASEADNLTADFAGGNHSPMYWNDRIFYVNDRDGTMNVWSMRSDGGDLRQHTRHSGWDVKSPDLHDGRIAYQLGADLWLHDVGSGESRLLPITLASDLDQLREKWETNPPEYLTSAHIDPKGDRVALTARGRVFVAPVRQGRRVQVAPASGVRYRDAVFMPDGDEILLLSDETGELEFRLVPADGLGNGRMLTDDGEILRFRGHPSPDGERIGYTDRNRDLWLLSTASGEQRRISELRQGIGNLAWAPDSRWLAFVQGATNTYSQIVLHEVASRRNKAITSDRVNSRDQAFSPDGKWLFFLSDRNLQSLVGSPWGPRQPEPYFDRPMEIFQIGLQTGLRPTFRPADELHEEDAKKKKPDEQAGSETTEVAPLTVALEGIEARLWRLPIDAGNYRSLAVTDKALFWLSRGSGQDAKTDLIGLPLENDGRKPEPKTVVADVRSYELSADGHKLLVRKGDELFVLDAKPTAVDKLAEHRVDLSGWSFPIDVREDFRQLFIDAWRLERDFFYDPGMHGVDWDAVRDKYLPLVDRVTTRMELSDLIGEVVGELSALHVSVRGGDHREGTEQIGVASLGARLSRDEAAGGYRVDYIYRTDPDYPSWRSPLADPYLDVGVGDVITAINGVATLSVPDPAVLLRNEQDQQVRLEIHSASTGDAKSIITVPIDGERDLRYADWQYTRRLRVEERGEGAVGYVHLRAMGGRNLTEWYRSFYPVFNRQGLIIDVRHNRGGNIDSIILEKLLRRAWFYWKSRVGEPYWNMQYAFRGHMVVLVDEYTASDGEAFAEGFKRLGLGEIIGTRTWGGEIWLSNNNPLTDFGLARAPQSGVYGPEGEWLIEGHGVDPDIVVDNLPHATFNGEDAQLDYAVDFLLEKMRQEPVDVPPPPAYPDKSFEYP